jgi:hypothetical protein
MPREGHRYHVAPESLELRVIKWQPLIEIT